MSIPEPEVRVTRFEVSCLPETHPDADLFTIVVEYRGKGRWAVAQRGACFDADGNRSLGPPGDREPVTDEEIAADNAARDDWLARHRFDEKAACALAGRLAPRLAYRGYTVADALSQPCHADALLEMANEPGSGNTTEALREGIDSAEAPHAC